MSHGYTDDLQSAVLQKYNRQNFKNFIQQSNQKAYKFLQMCKNEVNRLMIK